MKQSRSPCSKNTGSCYVLSLRDMEVVKSRPLATVSLLNFQALLKQLDVRWIQQLMQERNQNVPSETKILLRVGVHLGDVEHRDGDVYGDAVNIASRVQSLADPGGVSITQQVFDHLRNNEEAGQIAFPSLRFSPDLKRFRADASYNSLLAKTCLQ